MQDFVEKNKKNIKLPIFIKELELADKLIFIKRYAQAKIILGRLLQTHPTSFLLHLRYIELAVRTGDIEQTLRLYRLHQDTMVCEVGVVMLDQYNESSPPSVSKSSYEELLKKFGDFACAYYGIGFSLERMGEYDEAIVNYEKSLQLDPTWYPSYFGLSQSYYQKNSYSEGDYYFQAFEQISPFSIYGNFNTHRKLSNEFFAKGKYLEANDAIECLVQWLKETGQDCPVEIMFYKFINKIKITQITDKAESIAKQQQEALANISTLLQKNKIKNKSLLFMIDTCQDISYDDFIFSVYQLLLQKCHDPLLVKKICDVFFDKDDNATLIALLSDACLNNYDNYSLRFWLLVTKLKDKSINTNEYLADKEKIERLINASGEKLELLNLLHSLQARFADDPDVYRHLGVFYHKANHDEKAEFYLQKMRLLDPKAIVNAFTYTNYLLSKQDGTKALEILAEIKEPQRLKTKHRAEYFFLQARSHALLNEFSIAVNKIKLATKLCQWTISYLVCEIFCLSNLYFLQKKLEIIPEDVINLYENMELRSTEFRKETLQLAKDKFYYLAYVRAKLLFLYTKVEKTNSNTIAFDLINIAARYNPDMSMHDFIKLLNTNYDSPNIYFALAVLNKECWRHETASTWLEIMLQKHKLSREMQTEVYLELADSYVWREHDLATAIEYAKTVLKQSNKYHEKAVIILAHAYLRNNEIKFAQKCIENMLGNSNNYEISYLRGLLAYRCGKFKEAQRIWQPIVQKESSNLRFFNIRQEVLKLHLDEHEHKLIS